MEFICCTEVASDIRCRPNFHSACVPYVCAPVNVLQLLNHHLIIVCTLHAHTWNTTYAHNDALPGSESAAHLDCVNLI